MSHSVDTAMLDTLTHVSRSHHAVHIILLHPLDLNTTAVHTGHRKWRTSVSFRYLRKPASARRSDARRLRSRSCGDAGDTGDAGYAGYAPYAPEGRTFNMRTSIVRRCITSWPF